MRRVQGHWRRIGEGPKSSCEQRASPICCSHSRCLKCPRIHNARASSTPLQSPHSGRIQRSTH
jgi:hypothetical protein